MSEYTEREIMDQKYYDTHVSAMTSEGLHRKSDIAAELAHRDEVIEVLKLALIKIHDNPYDRDMIVETSFEVLKQAK